MVEENASGSVEESIKTEVWGVPMCEKRWKTLKEVMFLYCSLSNGFSGICSYEGTTKNCESWSE